MAVNQIRYKNTLYNISEDRDYFVLNDGTSIFVNQKVNLGNQGWMDLTSMPFISKNAVAIKPINVRLPMSAVVTKDGKSVFVDYNTLKSEYVDSVTVGYTGYQDNVGSFVNLDYTLLGLVPNYVLDEMYALTNDGYLIVLNKLCVEVKKIQLSFNATCFAIDQYGSKIFYGSETGIGYVDILNYEDKGILWSVFDVLDIYVDRLNNMVVVARDRIYFIGYVNGNYDFNTLKAFDIMGVVHVGFDEVKNIIMIFSSDGTVVYIDRNTLVILNTYDFRMSIAAAFVDYLRERLFISDGKVVYVMRTTDFVMVNVYETEGALFLEGSMLNDDIYSVSKTGYVLNIDKGKTKNLFLNEIIYASADSKYLYLISGSSSIVKLNADSYVPKLPVEINRGAAVTSSYNVTVNLNFDEITQFPSLMVVYEQYSDSKTWIPFSNLMHYTLSSELTSKKRNLLIEIVDQFGQNILLTSPDIYIDGQFNDTRDNADVVDYVEQLNNAASTANMSGYEASSYLMLEVNSNSIDIGSTVTLKVWWVISNVYKADVTDKATFIVSDSNVGMIVGNLFIGAKSGKTFIIASVFGLSSTSVEIKVNEIVIAPVVESGYTFTGNIVLSVDKSNLHVGEVGNLKVTMVRSGYNDVDMTDRIMINNLSSSVIKLDGSKVSGLKGGSGFVVATMNNVNSNQLKIDISGSDSVLDGLGIDTVDITVTDTNVNVGQSVSFTAIGKFNNGTSSVNITDSVDGFSVLDNSIGYMEGYIFYGKREGVTGVVATYKGFTSNIIYINVHAVSQLSAFGLSQSDIKKFGVMAKDIKFGALQDDNPSDGNVPPGGDNSGGGDGADDSSSGEDSSGNSEFNSSKAESEGSYAEAPLADVLSKDAIGISTGVPSSNDKQKAPDVALIHVPSKPGQGATSIFDAIFKGGSDNQDTNIIRSVLFMHTDIGVNLEGEAVIGVLLANAKDYHTYNIMDGVSVWEKGPKADTGEMKALQNDDVAGSKTNNNNQFRDPPLASMIYDKKSGMKSLSDHGRQYDVEPDGVHYDNMPAIVIPEEVYKLNNDPGLKQILVDVFRKYKIPPAIVASGMIALSGLNRRLIVKKPVLRLGLMQVTKKMAINKGVSTKMVDLINPYNNIELACWYINTRRDITGLDVVKIAAMYGAGKITYSADSPWGVLEPYAGYLDDWIAAYNGVITAMNMKKIIF